MLSKRLNIPHVWHIREFFGIDQLLPLKAYQRMTDRTDKFIVISSAMKKEYDNKLGMDKVIWISDGIAVPPECEKDDHDGFKILLAGRIAPAKLQLDAVKGFEYFKQLAGHVNAKLHLAGTPVTDGDRIYKNKIDEYIKDHALEEDIIFLGQVDDMAKLRSGMDIELMCSEREPFGRVTLEGMRAGLPIIGTASGGTLDIIKENISGLFYQPGNYKELGEKIYFLYNNPKQLAMLSESARKYGRTHFTEKQLLIVSELLEQTAGENAK
jgi:glycosyltransferase involved in cell wall biosynthesis